jgi:hypothetical protein
MSAVNRRVRWLARLRIEQAVIETALVLPTISGKGDEFS